LLLDHCSSSIFVYLAEAAHNTMLTI
jgi:hypothetical protein